MDPTSDTPYPPGAYERSRGGVNRFLPETPSTLARPGRTPTPAIRWPEDLMPRR